MESLLGTLLDERRVVAAPVTAGIFMTEPGDPLAWRGTVYLPNADLAQIGGTYTFKAIDGRVARLTLSSATMTPSGAIRVGFTGKGKWEWPTERAGKIDRPLSSSKTSKSTRYSREALADRS